MKFQFYQDASGQWRWRLKAKNNRVVADSAEGYTRRQGAEKAAVTIVMEIISLYGHWPYRDWPPPIALISADGSTTSSKGERNDQAT